MGLANRIVGKGEALSGATELAILLTSFPQRCMQADRLSAYQQWPMNLDDALANETLLGREVIRSGETRAGASRFAAGKGRHGDFENI